MRKRGSVEDVEVQHLLGYYNDKPDIWLDSEQTVKSTVKTCEDEVTPGYHTRIRAGEIINNRAKIVHEKTLLGSSSFESSGPNGPYSYSTGGSFVARVYGLKTQTWPLPDYDRGPMYERAKSHALSYVDSTPYQFAEDIAEIASTFTYLKLLTKRLSRKTKQYTGRENKLLRDLRLGKNTQSEMTVKLAKLYLEYRFVISPIVRSIHDLITAWNDKPLKPQERRTARGTGNGHYSVGKTDLTWTYHTRFLELTKVDVKAGIYYELNNPIQGFRFKYGIRNKDIPVTLWAIVPLSFMVDRVFNISNAIKGLTSLADPSIKFLAGWITTKESVTRQFFVDDVDTIPGWTKTVTGDPAMWQTFTYDRSPWTPSLPDIVPPLELQGLTRNIPYTLDALALTAAFLARMPIH
jgi:hypothetical protein